MRKYFIGDACIIDRQRIVFYYDLYYPESKVHFWNADLHVFFEENQDGELQSGLECDNNNSVEFVKKGQFYSGTIYR